MTTSDRLRVDTRDLAGAAVIEPYGVLDALSYAELRESLVKVATDEPRAVIVDLAELQVPDRAALALFFSVSDQIAQWPGVPLLLVASAAEHRELLDRYRMARYVPVYPSVTSAASAIDDPPARRIARRNLPNSLASARLARLFVLAMCAEWNETARADDAMTVVNELVENTLLHTYCAPSVRLELRRGLLTVAVYDDDPTEARLATPGSTPSRCRGLVLVSQLSRVWGCTPTPRGGKVVWAVL